MIKINAPARVAVDKGLMSRPKLVRDVVVVVVAKLVLVIAAGTFVFGPSNRPRIDAGRVENHLVGQSIPNSSSRSGTP